MSIGWPLSNVASVVPSGRTLTAISTSPEMSACRASGGYTGLNRLIRMTLPFGTSDLESCAVACCAETSAQQSPDMYRRRTIWVLGFMLLRFLDGDYPFPYLSRMKSAIQ